MQKAARLAKRAVDRISQAVFRLLGMFVDLIRLVNLSNLHQKFQFVDVLHVLLCPACVCSAGEGLVHLLCNGLGKDNFGKIVAFVYNSHSKDKGVKETRN